jgi:hypothetical protein
MRRFRFSATWLDGPANEEFTIELEELAATISRGEIANRSFIVRAA